MKARIPNQGGNSQANMMKKIQDMQNEMARVQQEVEESELNDEEVKLIGCEAGGKGVDTPYNAAALTNGKIGIFHGMKSIFNQALDIYNSLLRSNK